MRSVLWTLVGTLAWAGAASGEVAFKTVVDADWCDDHGWGSSSERHCEVREATWAATGQPITVDSQPNGGIEVVGWDRNEVRLRVKVVADAATRSEAKSRAAAVRIETEGVIRAKAGNQAWASFRLEVPRGSTLNLTSKNGGLHLRGLSGVVEARTDNGGVHLDEMGGKVVARTTNGGVHVQLSGESWDGESLDVETSNGGVHLQIPRDYNAHLQTSTVNGGIHAPESLRRQFEGKRLDVDLGRGGAPLRIETRNGGLHVN
jgi:hypothetical protein